MTSQDSIPMSKGAALALKSLYETGKYSDLTIKCGGKEFKVHRAILCPRSLVFAKMMDGDFKEANTGVIDLPDDEPFIITKLLDFLYMSDYSDELAVDTDPFSITSAPELVSAGEDNESAALAVSAPPNTMSGLPSASTPSDDTPPAGSIGYAYEPLVTNVKVYIVADFYDISELKDLAEKKYEAAVKRDWNTPSFAQSLRDLYENTQHTDRSLKEVAMDIADSHIQALLDRGEFASLIKQNGEIAFDFLSRNVQNRAVVAPAPGTPGIIQYACYNNLCEASFTEIIACSSCGGTDHIQPYNDYWATWGSKKGKKGKRG